jgi:hypothetical protein
MRRSVGLTAQLAEAMSDSGAARAPDTSAVRATVKSHEAGPGLPVPFPDLENVTDHAVLIPTSAGPIGAIISEPNDVPVASLFLLVGGGRLVAVGAGRYGTASLLARTFRDVASLGVVTFRFDYPAVNESHMAERTNDPYDLSILREVMSWFHTRTAGLPRLLAGVCFGSQLAVLLAQELEDVAGVALITPTLHIARGPQDAVGLGSTSPGRSDVDARTTQALSSILGRIPVWAFGGERELPGIEALRAAVGPRAAEIDVELIHEFHTKAWHTTHLHRVTRERTIDWAQRTVERIRRAPGTAAPD